jgi:hypothetical protein
LLNALAKLLNRNTVPRGGSDAARIRARSAKIIREMLVFL